MTARLAAWTSTPAPRVRATPGCTARTSSLPRAPPGSSAVSARRDPRATASEPPGARSTRASSRTGAATRRSSVPTRTTTASPSAPPARRGPPRMRMGNASTSTRARRTRATPARSERFCAPTCRRPRMGTSAASAPRDPRATASVLAAAWRRTSALRTIRAIPSRRAPTTATPAAPVPPVTRAAVSLDAS